VPAAGGASAGARRAGFGHLLIAEWTKIRSVRSTVWTLLLFVVITVGLTAGLTALIVSSWNGPRAAPRDARIIADPVSFILGAGIGLGQLTICVLGVLVVTTEYSTGVIRASLLAVPRRLPMLAAKAVVFAALLVVIAEIVAFSCYLIGSALLHSKVPVTLSDPGVTRAVVGAGLYLTALGLFALAIGALIRHTAGAITTVIGVVFVLPILSGLLPSDWWWAAHLNAYLPEQAGSLIYNARAAGNALLTPWQGLGVFCIWTALLIAAASYFLKRRDA
jgi:ABC-type transport system involved in multi-copper enzyme maturation permease subunit